jgi:hypothetical protein
VLEGSNFWKETGDRTLKFGSKDDRYGAIGSGSLAAKKLFIAHTDCQDFQSLEVLYGLGKRLNQNWWKKYATSGLMVRQKSACRA